MATHGKIVVLNGFPGTGKFTILKEVLKRLPSSTTHLLDNDLLIDPVTALLPERSDEHLNLREAVRKPVFAVVRSLAKEGHVILMTTCLADNAHDHDVFVEYLNLVRGTKTELVWVTVECDDTVLQQRLATPDRCQNGKTKLTTWAALQNMLEEHTLLEPWVERDEYMRWTARRLDASTATDVSVQTVLEMINS